VRGIILPPQGFESVVVSGAGTSLANGVYLRNGDMNIYPDPGGDPLPFFENPATGYRIYGEEVEGVWWALDASADGSDTLYEMQYAAPAPASVGPFTLDYPANPFSGDVITGSYSYSDAEGDPEGASTVQWYRSDSSDPAGAYSAIDGATGAAYTTTFVDEFRYLKFEVTPRSLAGTEEGEALMIGPSPLINTSG
jgi:hypothetical protein